MTFKIYLDFDTELLWGQIWNSKQISHKFTNVTSSNLLDFIHLYNQQTSCFEDLHTNWAIVQALLCPNLSKVADELFDEHKNHRIYFDQHIVNSLSPQYLSCPDLLEVLSLYSERSSVCNHSFFHLTPKNSCTSLLVNDFFHSRSSMPESNYYVFPEDIPINSIIRSNPDINFRINPREFTSNTFLHSNILPFFFGFGNQKSISNIIVPSFYLGATLRSRFSFFLHKLKILSGIHRMDQNKHLNIHIWTHPWEFCLRPSLLSTLINCIKYLHD